MAASKLRLTSLILFQRYSTRNVYNVVQKSCFCTSKSEDVDSKKVEKSDFLKFYEKQESLLSSVTSKKTESFVSMLRKSNFIKLGDPVGKVVIGVIYHIVGKDLYIEFGWKFPTVCTAPEKTRHLYTIGSEVKLLVKELEISTKFLGGDEEITLNEADCILLGLLNKPKRTESQPKRKGNQDSLLRDEDAKQES